MNHGNASTIHTIWRTNAFRSPGYWPFSSTVRMPTRRLPGVQPVVPCSTTQ